ncbi:MAG: hypothetical protein WCK34_13115, partial [Bacteroidota bacterium]
MNSQQFSELLKNPGSAGTQGIAGLADLINRYPYCQSAQLLYTYTLFTEDDPQYPSQLKKAAAYAGDRRILRSLIALGRPTGKMQADTAPPVSVDVPRADDVVTGPSPAEQAS